jgi:hypothetical protein
MELLVLLKTIGEGIVLEIEREEIFGRDAGGEFKGFEVKEEGIGIPQQPEFMDGKGAGKSIPRLQEFGGWQLTGLPANGLQRQTKHDSGITFLLEADLKLQTGASLTAHAEEMRLDVFALTGLEVLQEFLPDKDGEKTGQVA